MGYDYTIIQVVCWLELPEQRRLCPIFVKIWIPINGTQQCSIGSPEIHKNSTGLTGCQWDPRIWDVIAWYQSLDKQLPRELKYGYPQVIPKISTAW